MILIAFLARTPFYQQVMEGRMPGGLYNGYIATNKDIPLSHQGGAEWEAINVLDNLVHVHGGITYDSPLYKDNRIPMVPLTAIPEPEILDDLRVIGFDTCHYGDIKEDWDFEAVKAETLRLLEQIKNL